MPKRKIEEASGFDALYYFTRDLFKRTPILWWIAFGILGSILVNVVPVGEWAESLWSTRFSGKRTFWLGVVILGLAGALLIAFIRRTILDARSTSNKILRNKISKHFLLDDVPLKDGEPDELERTKFAEIVAPLLALPKDAESVVVGLEADWGEGKSSVLTLIESELGRHVDNPIVVRFNPWFVHSREQVLRAFFSHLIADIDASDKAGADAVQNLREYAKILQSVAKSTGSSLFESILDFRGKEKSLIEEKQLLATALDKLGRPVVVIIDDIDRLPKDDIRCIFQLVKIVCDFPRFSYLLAFDPAPVDRALKFDGLYAHGKQYREKVVQLSVRLPPAGFGVRRRYFEKRIVQRVEAWKLDPDADDQKAITDFTNLAVRTVSTAREIKRILNSWCLACFQLRGEVNYGDILLMELLLWKFPAVFDAIEADPRQLVGSGQLTNDFEALGPPALRRSESKSDAEKRKRLRDSLLEIHKDPSSRPVLGEILEALFPNVREVSRGEVESEPRHRRVRDRDTLTIYFGRRLPSGAIPNRDIRQFFEDPSSRGGLLDDAVRAKSLGAFFVFLRKEIRAPKDSVDLVRRICEAVDLSWQLNHDNLVEDADDVLMAAMREVDEKTAQEMLTALVGEKPNLVVAERVLSSMLNEFGVNAPFPSGGLPNKLVPSGHIQSKISHEQMRSAISSWLKSIESIGAKELIERRPNFMSVFFRWGQFSDPQYEKVRAALSEYIVNPETATAFSYGFAPRNGIPMGIDGVEQLLLDPRQFVNLLQKGGGLTSVVEQFIERFGKESPKVRFT